MTKNLKNIDQSADTILKEIIAKYYKQIRKQDIEVSQELLNDVNTIEQVFDHLLYEADMWINATGVCENYDELVTVSSHLHKICI